MISGVIPQTGRTCYGALAKLGSAAGTDLSDLIRVLDSSRKLMTPNLAEAQSHAVQFQSQSYPVALQPDRKRQDRPYRLALLGFDTKIDKVDVRIEGVEPHNCSSLIKLAEADFAIVGFDELLATMQTYLGVNSRYVTRWGNFNAELNEPTDVRIAGSANIKYVDDETGREFQDFSGLFLIGNRKWGYDKVTNMIRHGKKVYVKGRYEGVVLHAFPEVKTVPVKDVEDAVKSDGDGLGVEIVRSGRTAIGKGLYVYGEPLFQSESLLVADFGRYTSQPDLQRVIAALQPQQFFELERMINFGQWYEFLATNLGENWADRPDVGTLFEGSSPPSTLRPYSLKSRNWAPSDNLPSDIKLEQTLFRLKVVPVALNAGIRSSQ